MDLPLVSVIIPCYNGQDHILEAIESVDEQDYENIEIIVVDDGSTDDSISTVESFTTSKELILEKHRKNRGISEARNTGLKISKGSLISFIDQDDYWDEEKISRQVDYMREHPDVGTVITDLREVHEYNCSVHEREADRSLMDLNEAELAEYFFKFWESNPIPITTALYRSSIFDEFGMYDPHLFGANDLDLIIRTISKYKIGVINAPLVSKRYHSNNASKNKTRMIEDQRRISKKMIVSYPFLGLWLDKRRTYLDLQESQILIKKSQILRPIQLLLLSIIRCPTFSIKSIAKNIFSR